jgi:LacI family transcriptional regulator
MVDCDRMVTGMPQVQVENIQAMEQAVAHVVENGGKQVAVITGDMEHLNSQERLAGLQMALTRRQLALPDSHIIQEHGYNEASGIRGVEQLLKRNVPFDTLFCQNDLIALGAIRKLVSLGHCIPHTVKVVGFDNMEFADMPEIGLTTVDAHPHKLGEVSMRLLLDMLSGKHTDNVHLRVGSELIVRQTTVCRTMEKQYV